LLGWWYICIGVAFLLLGLRNLIAATGAWSVALRWVIAAGFIGLGIVTLRSPGSNPRR
jgi:hypothetical protein